jgi:metal-responsive CopG/Arc/MetJ family transcriptional regulator
MESRRYKMQYTPRSISFEQDVFERLEQLRGNQSKFRSRYINDLLREKLNLPRKEQK